MEKLINTNKAPPQQVYIIQLDHNVQFESQAIPLQILENDLDADLILPLLQQKQGEPLQLFVESRKELTDTAINNPQNIEIQNNLIPNIQINPDSTISVNTVNILEPYQNIQNSELQKRNLGVLPVVPIAVKTEPIKTINKDSNEFKGKNNRISTVKQKIKNYVHISDTNAPPRAVAVLPAALHFRGKLILPRRTLSPRIRFGPVQGIHKTITRSEAFNLVSDANTPVFLLNQDEEHVIYIDVTDKDKSNWLGLLPFGEVATPTAPTTANLWLYEENNELYALTVHHLAARTPLKLGYSKKYFEDHINSHSSEQPVLDLETVNAVQWWCNECNRSLQSAALLQRHTDVYHKDVVKSYGSSYRCKYCRKSFRRIFTLKRHILSNCAKIPKISTEKTQEPTESNTELDISSTLEDNRIPSDESFQNFTNSLDFSTNLFDTDRIALDISTHSRADSDPNDLNPYSIGFRDDNGLSNDLGFTKLTSVPEPVIQSNETNQKKNTIILDTCSYCNQIVVKESKSKHLRQCPSRLICECGKVFRHKKSLALHIHKSHPITQKTLKLKKVKPVKSPVTDDKEVAYKCQECSMGFKRRGMLVNHLWRIHKMISTMPVEKKVKHYPCVACPKIYRSATKRNKHVRVHHPVVWAEKLPVQSIEGGVKSCQPASCSECPRQYATRAKLLQHIRAHHPHLAKAISKQEMEKKAKTKVKTSFGKKEPTERYIAAGNQQQFQFY